MTIAFLVPHLRLSGGNKILFTYANLLMSRGHTVTVYVLSSNKIRRSIANFFQLKLPEWTKVTFRIKRVSAFTELNIVPHDHMIAGGYKEALCLLDLPKHYGEKYYMVQHDEGLYHGDRETVDMALQSPLKKIVVSSWLQEVVLKRAQQQAPLLLNPYDRKQFFPCAKGNNQEKVRILILDHSFSWKGTDEAIEIVCNLQKTYPEVELVGLGRRRKSASNLYDKYFFDPPQTEINDIYNSVDIFLCASWDEGFGLPSLEAMATGVAVVTYDNGGSRDFARDMVTAFVAPRKDKKALAIKLRNAVEDKKLRRAISKEGQLFVESMPTWAEQVLVLEDILLQS